MKSPREARTRLAGYLQGQVVYVIGGGGPQHRGVAVALAEAGADVAIGGSEADLAAEAALHSIANEVWAMGRRSTVVTLEGEDTASFANAVASVRAELGRMDLVVRCDPVLDA
jgi:NAD(P)-dependent dehydrogenase (short-subunit alcohol dehydrogenase family)